MGRFYGHTPLFATRISVIYADEEKIQVEVDYSIFGSRVMSHGPDGIGVDKPLGGGEYNNNTAAVYFRQP